MNNVLSLYHEFWNEAHWLPPGYNWSSLRNTPFETYPQFDDLTLPIFYAFIVLGIRAIFEWCIARPLGRCCGIKNTTSELPNIYYRILRFFRRLGSTNCNSDPTSAPKHLKLSRSTSHVKFIPKSTLDKFSESCWRFAFYFYIFIYGATTLWNKPYLWETSFCWFGYPLQTLTKDIYWYYIFELSFYWSLIVSQFVDVQRKDFWVNFVHHIATVLLMMFSWASNMVRMGALVLFIHDAADFWMEGAKMARYCRKTSLCNVMFAIFATVWFVTRCIFLPFWLLYSTLIETVVYIGFYESYYLLNSLLVLLQILHVFWTIMIFKILITALKSGEADDARSDSEDNDDETFDSNSKQN